MSRYQRPLHHGGREGVDVGYVKRRGVVIVGGWYDSFVLIEDFEIPLGRFLTELGITERDVRKALKAWTEDRPLLAAGRSETAETSEVIYECGVNGVPRCEIWPACEHADLPFEPLATEGGLRD